MSRLVTTGPTQRSGAVPLPAMKRWGRDSLRRGQRAAHYRADSRFIPTPWSPVCRRNVRLHHHPPALLPAQWSSRRYPSCLDADSLRYGRCRCCGRATYTPLPECTRRRTGAAHHPAGAAHARAQLAPPPTASRLHHNRGWRLPSPPRRDRDSDTRRSTQPPALGPLRSPTAPGWLVQVMVREQPGPPD